MQAHRPWCPCSPPAVATRVQTERARPTTFTRPSPTGAPRQPTADTLPHSFLRAPPSREAFPRGAGPPLGTPRSEQPSSTTKGGERRAALFAFLRSYIIIYARVKGTFPPLGGRGSVRPAVENGKAGRNAREGGHFLHTVEKTVENKLWISGKSARFFHRSATNGGEAANGARAAGR